MIDKYWNVNKIKSKQGPKDGSRKSLSKVVEDPDPNRTKDQFRYHK